MKQTKLSIGRIIMLLLVNSALIVLLTSARQPEGKITGTITDKTTKEGVGFATVAILTQDSTLVSGTSADIDGKYSIEVPQGKYILRISILGYRDYSKVSDIRQGLTLVEDIELEQDTQMLASASVSAKVPTIQMKLDKLVVNVSQSAFANGSTGLELLKKSPGVIIDNDGNITVNGKAVSVWIDGRPSYLDGKSLESLLKSTNGSSIDKIEIIEHPSSKFDAQGQGGIINIKTKKTLAQGLCGSIGASTAAMYIKKYDYTPFEYSSYGNLSYRTNKTNSFINLSQNRTHGTTVIDMNSILSEENGVLRQVAQDFVGSTYFGYQAKIGSDWFIDKKNTLGFIVSLPGTDAKTLPKFQEGNTTQTYLDDIQIETSSSTVITKSGDRQKSGNLNFTHVFDEQKSSEVTINADYYNNKQYSSNNTCFTIADVPVVTKSSSTVRDINADNTINIYSARVDYQSVLWNSTMFEAGAKWSMSKTYNDTERTETTTPLVVPANAAGDPTTTISTLEFNYREHIAAGYVSFSRNFGKSISFKGGLRAEYTNSFGDWISAGEKTSNDYINLFPAAFVGINPNGDSKVKYNIVYTRRINRPIYRYLNPTEEYIDAHTFVVGDPQLKPEYINTFDFQTMIGNHLSLVAEYARTSNMIIQSPTYYGNGTKSLKRENFGVNNQYVLVGNVSGLNITKWMTFSANIVGAYMHNTSKENSYSKGKVFGQGSANLTFLLPRNWTAELDGNYQSSLIWGFFRIHPSLMTNIGAKKSLLDGKMTLSIILKDIFRTSGQNVDMIDPSTDKTTTVLLQKYLNQRVSVGLSYNFGHSNKSKARNVGNLEETSRVSSGSGFGQ